VENTIAFRFDGKLATDGEIDFYEASRFQYGASRLLYTLEGFRKTGKVPKRVTLGVADTKFRVSGARPACWELFVREATQAAASTFVSLPISVLLEYALHLLFPPKKQAENIDIEKLESILQTQSTVYIAALEAIKTADRNSTELAKSHLETINKLVDALIAKGDKDTDTLDQAKSLKSSLERADTLSAHKQEIDKIGYERSEKLIKQTRTQVAEMGRPLIKSANKLTIVTNPSGRELENVITAQDIETLSGNTIDDSSSVIEGILKSYDKETGWGKIREIGTKDILYFQVRRKDLRNELESVTEAMNNDEVSISGKFVRDRNSVIKYMIYEEYLGIAL
jgi:hypothetical protein